ncbi:hypothetical protein NMY22_g18564 [Coprinellus aureogranulatus]|nr:hypothetical protein NMY22_g18564 [Coprinellus aureogranulatus]
MYRHFAPSNTSLSDNDYDDDEPAQSNFFIGDQPLFIDATIQPHWSRSYQSDYPAFSRKSALKSPISSIPPELLIFILKHLHTPRDLLSSLRVSRTWCECAVELLWHKPAFTRYTTLEKMAKVLKRPDQTFSYAKFIRRLNFLNLGKELKDETFITFAQCDRLERLTLSGCHLLTAPHIEASLIKFPNLVALDLTNVKETTNEAIISFAKLATRLQGINLQNCTKISDAALIALAQHCPILRRVKLSGLEGITDEGVTAIVKGCPLLLEIDLHQCENITDVTAREIWMHSLHMRELRLSQCSKITDFAFPVAPKFDINGDPIHPISANPFPNRDSAELPPLVINRVFDQLRMLDLTACANITDDAVEGIISHAPKIRNLVLSKCVLLTDRSVEAICTLGRNLHYLHFGHASKVTDKSVKALARSCNRIRYVDFANCTNLTDMSVFELSALPKLRRIGLVRCSNLTDEAIYALAERHATLERIHLSYCDQISVMAVHFLLLKLHKLTHLSLTGVPAFRQPELQRFCREAPRDFSSAQRLSFCVFSGKGIAQLRAYLTELFDRITEQNGTDDTEYEEEDDDTIAFHENTPEPDAGDAAPEDTPLTSGEQFTPQVSQSVLTRGARNDPRMYELALQRERAVRSGTIPSQDWLPPLPPFAPPPARGPGANREQAESAVQGATTALNRQLRESGGSRRESEPGSRNIADVLPIVESSATSNQLSPPVFVQPGQYYPPQTITHLQPGNLGHLPAYTTRSPRTPDLDFAEIGHGRGANGHGASSSTSAEPHHWNSGRPSMEVGATGSSSNTRSFNSRSMSDPVNSSGFSFSHPGHPPPGNNQDGALQGQPPIGTRLRESRASRRRDNPPANADSSRGRAFRSRIRNGLNIAENYASSFTFLSGRFPAPRGSRWRGWVAPASTAASLIVYNP